MPWASRSTSQQIPSFLVVIENGYSRKETEGIEKTQNTETEGSQARIP
jgi:hypothetical protein